MKVVFVAGPLTPKADLDPVTASRVLFENTEAAKMAALLIMEMGAIPIVPHTNTGWALRKVPEPRVRLGYLTILARCDAMFRLPGSLDSNGARAEYNAAHDLGIPIFTEASAEDMRAFIKGAADGSTPL